MAEAEAGVEVVEPAAEPEPTAETAEDTSPRAVALVNSNVRSGDSTDYQIVGFLLEGETADIRGVSSRGSRWFFIQLANGISGFIHPGIVHGRQSKRLVVDPSATAATDADPHPDDHSRCASTSVGRRSCFRRRTDCAAPSPL